MLRAVRFTARTGWEMDERTKARYQNAKAEGLMEQISAFARGYELEEIAHEEDPLRALRALEAEGWMKVLDPAWTAAKADVKGLDELNRILIKLLVLGVNPDPSAAHIELLTAKMQPKDVAALKRLFPRRGFVEQWNHLEQARRIFPKSCSGKRQQPFRGLEAAGRLSGGTRALARLQLKERAGQGEVQQLL